MIGWTVRDAAESEVEASATLWHDGWQDAHAAILPADLLAHETAASFADRLRSGLPTVRVVGEAGRPLGFAMVKRDELDQIYVYAEARGTGVAAALLADAERVIAAAGPATAWLACGIGNDRAEVLREARLAPGR